MKSRFELKKKRRPALDKVEANWRGLSTSLDYNRDELALSETPALWDAEVTKMIQGIRARPIDEADAKDIAAYLKKNYGELRAPGSTVWRSGCPTFAVRRYCTPGRDRLIRIAHRQQAGHPAR